MTKPIDTKHETKPIELVELKPLSAVVGSYICALPDADFIDQMFVEASSGELVRKSIPKKRFRGAVGYNRFMTGEEANKAKQNLPLDAGVTMIAEQRVHDTRLAGTIKVPADMAKDLVARGICARV